MTAAQRKKLQAELRELKKNIAAAEGYLQALNRKKSQLEMLLSKT